MTQADLIKDHQKGVVLTTESCGLALARSLLLLTPPIFSHPLWSELIHNPDKTARLTERLPDLGDSMLQKRDFTSACQLYLAAAALERRFWNLPVALDRIRTAERIAEEQQLNSELIWVDWGFAAITLSQGKLQAAGAHLSHLQEILAGSGEWVLANLVEFVCQQLPEQTADSIGHSLFDDWLLLWGDSPEEILAAHARGSNQNMAEIQKRFASRLKSRSFQFWKLIQYGLTRLMFGESHAMLTFRVGLQNSVLESFYNEDPIHSELNAMNLTSHQLAIREIREQALENTPDRSSVSLHPYPVVPVKEPANHVDLSEATVLVYCLGKFRVLVNEIPIEKWPGRKSLSVLKFLITHRQTPVSKEILMDIFWPDAEAEAARRNLHQAIYALRQAAKQDKDSNSLIHFENDMYFLNPELSIWIDYEEFEKHTKQGLIFEKKNSIRHAMAEFEMAEEYYQGHFLSEDLYEDWLQPLRQFHWQQYLQLAYRLVEYHKRNERLSGSIAICQKILTLDNTEEEAHRYLMECYLLQGQRNLAIRQYERCVQVLKSELNLSPSSETQEIYRQLIAYGARL